jgi:NAD(P)-dependent dehydrogenase (short-subunit alcohol dehydrogenase family)
LTSVAFLELLDAGNKHQNFPAKSQIVTVGSIGAFLRLVGGTSYSYNPSKAAATQLAKMFASNFVQWGIRAVSWYPQPSLNKSEFVLLIDSVRLERDSTRSLSL